MADRPLSAPTSYKSALYSNLLSQSRQLGLFHLSHPVDTRNKTFGYAGTCREVSQVPGWWPPTSPSGGQGTHIQGAVGNPRVGRWSSGQEEPVPTRKEIERLNNETGTGVWDTPTSALAGSVSGDGNGSGNGNGNLGSGSGPSTPPLPGPTTPRRRKRDVVKSWVIPGSSPSPSRSHSTSSHSSNANANTPRVRTSSAPAATMTAMGGTQSDEKESGRGWVHGSKTIKGGLGGNPDNVFREEDEDEAAIDGNVEGGDADSTMNFSAIGSDGGDRNDEGAEKKMNQEKDGDGEMSVGGEEPEVEIDVMDGLSWSELIRKFDKHNPGREAISSATAAEQTIRHLILRCQPLSQPRYSIIRSHISDFLPYDPTSSTSATWAPIVPQRDHQAIENSITKTRSAIENKNATDEERNQARVVLALGHYALGRWNEVIKEMEDLASWKETLERGMGNYGVTLRFVGGVLQAFALERLSRPSEALVQYWKLVQVYDKAIMTIPALERHDELARWGENMFYRFAMLTREVGGTPLSTQLFAHRSYFHFAQKVFGPAFRLPKRTVLLQSYLRLLLDSFRAGTYSPASTAFPLGENEVPDPVQTQSSTASPSTSTAATKSSPQAWGREIRKVVAAQERALQGWTTLPKAGDINRPYLEFVDLCMEGWRLAGSEESFAKDLIEILYGSMRFTFQSHRVLRHLLHVHISTKEYTSAHLVLSLYFKLWDKAHETDMPSLEKEMRRLHETYWKSEHVNRPNTHEEDWLEEPGAGGECDMDEIADFVETVLVGCRVLIKYLGDGGENAPDEGEAAGETNAETAERLLSKAAEFAEHSEIAKQPELLARLEGLRGVVSGALAQKGDLDTRSNLQNKALTHLTKAIQLDPESQINQYHFAFLKAELRDIPTAIEAARKAVQLQSTTIGWHLLALLMTAQKDFNGALEVVEATVDDDNDTTDNEDDDERSTDTLSSRPSGGRLPPSHSGSPQEVEEIQDSSKRSSSPASDDDTTGYTTPFEDSRPVTSNAPAAENKQDPIAQAGSRLAASSENQDAAKKPAVNDAVDGVPSAPQVRISTATEISQNLDSDEPEDLEAEVQIRMTRSVIIEVLEGAEAAVDDQRNLFQFFSKVSETIKGANEPPQSYPFPSKSAQEGQLHRKSTSSSRLKSRISISACSGQVPAQSASLNSKSQDHSALHRQPSRISKQDARSNHEPDHPTASVEDNRRARELLVDMWLLSAATFRRAGKTDDCRAAIQEAEVLDEENPNVWVQLALLSIAENHYEFAHDCLRKALIYDTDHIPAVFHLSKLYYQSDSPTSSPDSQSGILPDPLPPITINHIKQGAVWAQHMLEDATETNAWDIPEFWWLLSRCYQRFGRKDEEIKKCLEYALDLERTKPIRTLQDCVPRCL